ncbi:hypothetical protein P4O66_019812 [Electrophorus voltai]|uniref:non-specific serine/threonine protein kinase n=1 Tax=Electrophorus voltai TaxID=2609070 RepID=A0AAD8ZUD1_9TELE|nr:hypothetical protein P4O66_019812 [Electrophorus voltai]
MDKYEKVKKIGEGSFGKAILVRSREDGHQYVIKEIGISRMSNKERQESRKEVAVLANMSHPNIVQYKESFEENGCLYIIMDYCEGGDLFKKINNQKGILFSEEQFEAGNMKNLVLKIIRGSYPPVSVHYSQDLRTLLGQLFRRNPRERPSVSAILDKPFLTRRINRFLSPQLIAQEFSTSLLLKQPNVSEDPVVPAGMLLSCPIGTLLPSLPAKRPVPCPAHISSAQKITKPAAKYGVPLTVKRPADMGRKAADVAKKPADRKPGVKLKQAPPPAAVQRRMSRMEEEERRKHEEGVRKKRLEIMERERKQREQLNRINRAREQGWRHVLSSSGGSSPERKFYGGGGMGAPPPPPPAPVPAPVHIQPPLPGPTPAPKEVARASADNSPATVAGDPRVLNGHVCLPHLDSVNKGTRRTSLQNETASKNDYAHRLRAQLAAEKAKQVEEFLQRKREAMLNKVRAEGQLGARQNLAAIFVSRTNSSRCRRPRVNKEEEEYLSRLRQIRLQNFNERQQIKARLRGEKQDGECPDSKESFEELELRRKKIEALKAQSKARAAVLKEQLEKKRREAYEREKRAWEDHLVARGVKVAIAPASGVAPAAAPLPTPPPQPNLTPQDTVTKASLSCRPTAPAISMTAALKDVGAIVSGQNSPTKEAIPNFDTAAVQSERKEILRRLNQNLKTQISEAENVGEATPTSVPQPAPQTSLPVMEERPPSGADRRRWEAGAQPILPVAQQTLVDTCSSTEVSQSVSPEAIAPNGGDRKRWQAEAAPLSVAHQTLDETILSTAEQTVGEVIPMEPWKGEGLMKAWGPPPVLEVLKVLGEEVELQPVTQGLSHASICDNTLTKSLKPTVEPSNETDSSILGPSPQPIQSAFDQNQESRDFIGKNESQLTAICLELEQQSEYEKTVSEAEEDRSCEQIAGSTENILNPIPGEKETEGADEVDSLVLEEGPLVASKPPARVMHAWEQETLQPQPGGGSVILEEQQKEEDRGNEAKQAELTEAAFVKVSCSPVHRLTVALSVLSAQSSVEDSSSSLASRSRSVSPLRSRRTNDALLIGLFNGFFDANNPKMLRTCSLPDLGKLFSASEPDGASAHDNNLEMEDLEDKEDEPSETEDIYEDEDLRELRASMERLLHQRHSNDASDEDVAGSNGSPGDEDERRLSSAICIHAEDEVASGNGSEAGLLLSNGLTAEEEEEQSSERQLNEEWHSDGSEEEEASDSEQQDSIFSRLEELRFHLEQAMGFEHFIEAYNKIKAIHEDEDENIDMGSSMVQSILGHEHQHLYPKILHLVMADGAYQEVTTSNVTMTAAWE